MREKLDLSLSALNDALARSDSTSVEDRFAPLAEALVWAVIVNDVFWNRDPDRYPTERGKDEAGLLMEGLRYARHRLVHEIDVKGMHDTVIAYSEMSSVEHSGEVGSPDPDTTIDHPSGPKWVWREVDGLPPAQDRSGEDIYRTLIGEDVAHTLIGAAAFLTRYDQSVAV